MPYNAEYKPYNRLFAVDNNELFFCAIYPTFPANDQFKNGGMKILVVDDRQSLSDLVAQFLGRAYHVTTVENGMQALGSLQGGNVPDLIITDLEMPEMDGFELIKQLKVTGLFSDIPIIVLSCRDSSADRIKSLQLGADDFLVKPFNPEELLIRVDKLVIRQ